MVRAEPAAHGAGQTGASPFAGTVIATRPANTRARPDDGRRPARHGDPVAATGADAAAATPRRAASAKGSNPTGRHRRRAVGCRRHASLDRIPTGGQGVCRTPAETE